jgi:ribosomal-protein-alanine N-acetyltransferase
MNWWRALRSPAAEARIASPADRAALSKLLAETWRRHGITALEEQAALLASGASAIAFSGEAAAGFLGVALREPAGAPAEEWADLPLVALNPDAPAAGLLGALFEAACPELERRGVHGVASLTPEGWLRDGLLANDFVEVDQVVGYARRGSRRAPAFEPAAVLRPAGVDALDAILALNAAAFDPLWQYDASVIMSWLISADHAVLAEVGGRPAGFALSSRGASGQYTYLVRVAVDPAFQGRGIGRQLVADAIRFADQDDAPGVALNTQASNAASRRLYEGLGFEPAGQTLAVLVRALNGRHRGNHDGSG